MNQRFRYHAALRCGAFTGFEIVERSESIASVEAKIHVERWLAGQGSNPSALVAFDLLSVTPV